MGKPNGSLLLPGVPVTSPGDGVTRGVYRHEGSTAQVCWTPWPVVGAGAAGLPNVIWGGSQGSGAGVSPQHQPSPPHSRQFGSPRTHRDGNPENVTARSSVPGCHQASRWPSLSTRLPRVQPWLGKILRDRLGELSLEPASPEMLPAAPGSRGTEQAAPSKGINSPQQLPARSLFGGERCRNQRYRNQSNPSKKAPER